MNLDDVGVGMIASAYVGDTMASWETLGVVLAQEAVCVDRRGQRGGELDSVWRVRSGVEEVMERR